VLNAASPEREDLRLAGALAALAAALLLSRSLRRERR
jgi:hypothetical protein